MMKMTIKDTLPRAGNPRLAFEIWRGENSCDSFSSEPRVDHRGLFAAPCEIVVGGEA